MNSVEKQRRCMENHREIPTLLELCKDTAIANLRFLGDVGETDLYLLKDILPHCTLQQLQLIEDETERDLSPVTNDIWKTFYKKSFGSESMNNVINRMRQNKKVFPWRELYKAKQREREQAQDKSGQRLKRLYEEEQAKKKSKQIKLCEKLPPGGSRRSYFGGSRWDDKFTNSKSNLMKKARIDFLKSREAQNRALTVMRRNTHQGKNLHQSTAPSGTKGNKFVRSDAGSSSRQGKPV